MQFGTRLSRTLCALLAALLLLSLLPVPVHADAATPEAEGAPAEAPIRADGEYIVRYRDPSLLPQDSSLPFAVVSGAELRELLDEDLLEYYEENGEAELLEGDLSLLGASSFYADSQWNLDMIGAEPAFVRGFLGQGVRVGVIDSGINPHPAFGARLLEGRNYADDSDPGNTRDTVDHGTRVAGLIGGAEEGGYIGAAPGVELIPLKCTYGSSVPIDAICAAIYGGVGEFHCDVLNLSLGTHFNYRALEEAVVYAVEHDVVVVAAAGNDGNSSLYYPAAYDMVIGVGSVNASGNRADSSNYNESVFLTAPGVQIRSTAASGGYGAKSGTSFSTPQVAAAAAVLLGIEPTLKPEEILLLLSRSAQDRGAEGYDVHFGHGILNIAGSVELLLPSVTLYSPDGGAATQICNNRRKELRCLYFLAEYGETGALLRLRLFPLTVPPWETVPVEAPPEGHAWAQFLCEAETLRPLVPAISSAELGALPTG